MPTGIIHAQEEVISSGTVPQGTNVSLKAGQSIRLEGGFNSNANADLEIIIENCTPDTPEYAYQVSPTDVRDALVNVFDINGQLIHSEKITRMGTGEIQVKAGIIAAGTYSYSLVVNGNLTDTKRMVIVK